MHVIDDGLQDVMDAAGVIADAVEGAEGVVEGIGVFADEIFGVVDAQAAQVCGTGRADVGQVGELVQVVAADFGGVHEGGGTANSMVIAIPRG